MTNKLAVTTVDRLLQDVSHNGNEPFGGVPILFAGDFRQVLPVVEHGNEADVLNACRPAAVVEQCNYSPTHN